MADLQSEYEAWTCPNCSAQWVDDSASEECWDCGTQLCEGCAVHTDSGVACEEHS
jgi:hypothetical protein